MTLKQTNTMFIRESNPMSSILGKHRASACPIITSHKRNSFAISNKTDSLLLIFMKLSNANLNLIKK